jgi:hypothetical protein
VLGDARIRVDVLAAANNQTMLIVRNLESVRVAADVQLFLQGTKQLREQFSGETLTLKPDENGVRAALRLQSKEVKVYRD